MNLFGLNSYETKRIVALYLACEMTEEGGNALQRAEKYLAFLVDK